MLALGVGHMLTTMYGKHVLVRRLEQLWCCLFYYLTFTLLTVPKCCELHSCVCLHVLNVVRVGGMEQQTDLSFISAAAGYGCQVAVYSTASIIIVSHALHHTALLPSTVPMVVYQVLCILSYFSLQHVIPWPVELEATLVSMTIYVRPSMYDGLHMGTTCRMEVERPILARW